MPEMSESQALKSTGKRNNSIDLLRGFIMMTMALDHASAMIAQQHFTEIWGVPFAGYPSWEWWLTRFLSHICAPGFFFLMGMSIFIFAEKRLSTSWSLRQIHQYFLKRGGIIILLMFFLEFPAWVISTLTKAAGHENPFSMPGMLPEGSFPIPTTVLYGLGACMMIGGFLWRLKGWQLLLITFLSFVLSAFYISNSDAGEMFNPFEHFFLVPGMSPYAFVLYPVVPWLGITTFGIFWGKLLKKMPEHFYKISLLFGLLFISVFMLIRWMDAGNFEIADNDSFIGFFTLVKYPPSVAFALITCGINLLLLVFFSLLSNKSWVRPVRVFGQTAMFFYLAHLYLYAFISFAFPEGCSVLLMYFVWLCGLIILYFICDKFLQFKKGKSVDSRWRMI